MKKIIISAILIFALTNYAYGLGRHHHHRGGSSGGSPPTDQALIVSDSNGGGNGGDSNPPVSVPEPATILLVGSGLIGLAGLARKKIKK